MSVQYQVPPEFSFVASEWPMWIKRYERFMTVSGLANKDEKTKIDTLIYSYMGQKAEEVMVTIKLTEEEGKKYACVKEKMDAFFIPKVNLVYQRAKFNTRNQQEG